LRDKIGVRVRVEVKARVRVEIRVGVRLGFVVTVWVRFVLRVRVRVRPVPLFWRSVFRFRTLPFDACGQQPLPSPDNTRPL
jgi:hypothetical protein